MASIKERLAALFRRLERRLGVDREGRSVWVWLLPPCVGIASAVLVAFMPGIPNDVGWVYRLPFSFFALITMTAIAAIYLITFDNDHNQQAASDDESGRGDDGPEKPPVRPDIPPPEWVTTIRKVDDSPPDDGAKVDESPQRERVPAGAHR
ncbi:MAG: hypothetical protein WAW53_14175 [Candidatus Dormiibacterota bacterium]